MKKVHKALPKTPTKKNRSHYNIGQLSKPCVKGNSKGAYKSSIQACTF